MLRVSIYSIVLALFGAVFGAAIAGTVEGAIGGALLGLVIAVAFAMAVDQTGAFGGPSFAPRYGVLFDQMWWVFNRNVLFFLSASASDRFHDYVKSTLRRWFER
jgi:CDP-diglyceride synthetase